jgi:hypothetical protein
MVGQTSTVYFQCYQMVYDLAVRAEAGFRFERGLADSSYIQFGYWDSLKKGLMAGERLYADIKRMGRGVPHDTAAGAANARRPRTASELDSSGR